MASSHALGPTDIPLIEETISANFEKAVAARPRHEALISVQQGLRFSYDELKQAVNRLACGLHAAGLRRSIPLYGPGFLTDGTLEAQGELLEPLGKRTNHRLQRLELGAAYVNELVDAVRA